MGETQMLATAGAVALSTTEIESKQDWPPSVLAWLMSLRIPREQAQEYAATLLELGFDDVQSLQEDTTEEDLRQANMKPGHVRRTIKALHRLRNASLISPGDPPPWSPSCSSSPVPCVHFTMANPHVADPSAATEYEEKPRLTAMSRQHKLSRSNTAWPSSSTLAVGAATPPPTKWPATTAVAATGAAASPRGTATGKMGARRGKTMSTERSERVTCDAGLSSLCSCGSSGKDLPPAEVGRGHQPQPNKRAEARAFSSIETLSRRDLSGILCKDICHGEWDAREGAESDDVSGKAGKSSIMPQEGDLDDLIDEDVEVEVSSDQSSKESRSPMCDHNISKSGREKLLRVSVLTNAIATTAGQTHGCCREGVTATYSSMYDRRPKVPGRVETGSFPSNRFGTATATSGRGDRDEFVLGSTKSLQRNCSSSSQISVATAAAVEVQEEKIWVSAVEDGPSGARSVAKDPAPAPTEVPEEMDLSWNAGNPGGGEHYSSGGIGSVGPSLELSIPMRSPLEQSYEFTESGTLEIDGFVLNQNGMKSTPISTPISTPKRSDSLSRSGRIRSSRTSSAEKSRGSARPPLLQTTFESDAHLPYSCESSFGAGLTTGAIGDHGRRGGWGGRTTGFYPPPSTTTTSRRMGETTIILEELGRGGGGKVHKALHVPSMRLVAVKIMEVHDDEKRHQLIRELKTLNSMVRVPLVLADQSDLRGSMRRRRSGGCSSSWDNGRDPDGSVESWTSDEEINSPALSTGTSMSSLEDEAFLSNINDNIRWPEPPHREIKTMSTIETATVTPSSGRGSFKRSGSAYSWGFRPESRSTCIDSTATPANGQQPGHKHYRRRGSNVGGIGVPMNHVPVVAFHDAYTEIESGSVCMVMEYMDGGTLQKFVSQGESLSDPALAAVARSVLRGLAHMHSKHQIHRDIKPSNILLDRNGRVKLSDFGVVRELTETGSLAKTFTGTLTYMSPERITHKNYSYSSDIWSLGLVIVTLALGKFPLRTQGSLFDMMQAIATDPVPALSRKSFTPELCDFVDSMLQRNPADRPTARAMLRHPFLARYHNCRKLADLVNVPPATPPQVRALLTKVVEYHMETDLRVRGSFPHNTGGDGEQWGGRPLVSRLYKSDVTVLAAQLQLTRTELLEEYNLIRRRMEKTRTSQSKRSSRSGGYSTCSGGGSGGEGGGANNNSGLPLAPDQLLHPRRRASMPARMSSSCCQDTLNTPTPTRADWYVEECLSPTVTTPQTWSDAERDRSGGQGWGRVIGGCVGSPALPTSAFPSSQSRRSPANEPKRRSSMPFNGSTGLLEFQPMKTGAAAEPHHTRIQITMDSRTRRSQSQPEPRVAAVGSHSSLHRVFGGAKRRSTVDRAA